MRDRKGIGGRKRETAGKGGREERAAADSELDVRGEVLGEYFQCGVEGNTMQGG